MKPVTPRPIAQYAGHDLLVRPFATDFLEIRARLPTIREQSTPIPVQLNYPVLIVGAVPVVTASGARSGTFVLPTIDDIDLAITSRDSRYAFGERYDEGESTAPNARISLRAFDPNGALLRMRLGQDSGQSELTIQFGWRDFVSVGPAGFLPAYCSIALLLQRLDGGSQNGG